jgi:uncharacterized membrane protein YphA (DoxX/SURF4 family)
MDAISDPLSRLATPAVRWLALLGLCAAYLQGGIVKLTNIDAAIAEMNHFGLSPAAPFAIAVIALELVASAAILTGYGRWLGALALGGFTVTASFMANRYWELGTAERFAAENAFYEHLGLAGGFLLVAWHDLRDRGYRESTESWKLIKELYMHRRFPLALLAAAALLMSAADLAHSATTPASMPAPVAVGPQYDTTHVYVAPADIDRFVASFLATFGGHSTKQVVATVTPTPSSTTSQLLQTPVGTVSLFGFTTPTPFPFGAERTGYLVTDIDVAIKAARAAGADVLVEPFPDPIGRDAVIQWPGGVNTQIYWHTTPPSYAPFQAVPENRVYVSRLRSAAFVKSFLRFSHGKVVSDDAAAPGVEIGRAGDTYRRIRIESAFGKLAAFVTDGHLPYPYGRELTGYEVTNLNETLAKAKSAGAAVLVEPYGSGDRRSAMVLFPGGYVAEIHAPAASGR